MCVSIITYIISFPSCRVSRTLASKTACALPARPLCLVTRLSHALRALGDRVGLGETCASIISGGCAGHL